MWAEGILHSSHSTYGLTKWRERENEFEDEKSWICKCNVDKASATKGNLLKQNSRGQITTTSFAIQKLRSTECLQFYKHLGYRPDAQSLNSIHFHDQMPRIYIEQETILIDKEKMWTSKFTYWLSNCLLTSWNKKETNLPKHHSLNQTLQVTSWSTNTQNLNPNPRSHRQLFIQIASSKSTANNSAIHLSAKTHKNHSPSI